MKKFTLLTSLFFLTAIISNAQYKWSAGYQLGIGNSNISNLISSGFNQEIDANSKAAITNQIFINRQLTKKTNIEAGIGISSWNYSQRTNVFWQLGAIGKNDIIRSENISYNLTISLKYKILNRKHVQLFIPIGFNNLLQNSKQSYSYALLPSEWYKETDKSLKIGQNIFTGVEASWKLNKRLYITTQAILGYKLNEALDSWDLKVAGNNQNNNHISYNFQTGIGYRF